MKQYYKLGSDFNMQMSIFIHIGILELTVLLG